MKTNLQKIISKNEINNIVFTDNMSNQIIGKLAQRLFVHYIGPNIVLKAGKSTGRFFSFLMVL
jgi:ABC-type Zn uptake system ZnuABC Zn-binding protein ZnuA